MGGSAIAIALRDRAASVSFHSLNLPVLPAPNRATRLMVFAPHPDDETLGCAGLIQQTIESGGKVEVVILTNGDAFRTAVECFAHKLNVQPADYIRFAAMRREESRHALNLIGVPSKDVIFLGYPDQGTMPIWNSYWNRNHPYLSPYTDSSHSPYEDSFHPSASYCGASILHDVESVMEDFQPTLITVTHPAEDHPDHRAASDFVTLAYNILRIQPRDNIWISHAKLFHYIIHRGDWPLPEGVHQDIPLSPPSCMDNLDTRWFTLHLTPKQTKTKLASIDAYKSQVTMMGAFLHSFARSSELYGELPTANLQPPSKDSQSCLAALDGDAAHKPLILNPVKDDLLRDFNSGANIRSLYAWRESNSLCLLLECSGTLSNRYRYRFYIRALTNQGQSSSQDVDLTVHASSSMNQDNIETVLRGKKLLVTIPWTAIQADTRYAPIQFISIDAQTLLSGIIIDNTGERLMICSPTLNLHPLRRS